MTGVCRTAPLLLTAYSTPQAIFAVIVTFVEEAAHPVIEKAISPEPKLHEVGDVLICKVLSF